MGFKWLLEVITLTLFYAIPFLGSFQILALCLLAFLFTPLWPFVILYVGWTVFYDWNTQDEGGRPASNFMRNLPMFKLIRDYYPITLEKMADLDPSKNYIFGYHPHGLLGVGAVVGFQTEALEFSQKYPGITPHMAVFSGSLKLFVHRDIMMSLGFVGCAKTSLQHILTKMGPGHSVVVIPGGAAELLYFGEKDRYDLVIKNRKGFVRLALETGSDLVPVFGFGENNIFSRVGSIGGWYWQFQQWCYHKAKQYTGMGMVCPMFYGKFGFISWHTPINIVVGSPIHVTKTTNPTGEEVDGLHAKYIGKLETLFNEHREKYNVPQSTQLKIM